MITLKVGHTCLLNSLFQIYWCSDKCTIIKNFDFVFIDNMIWSYCPVLPTLLILGILPSQGFSGVSRALLVLPGRVLPSQPWFKGASVYAVRKGSENRKLYHFAKYSFENGTN